MNRRDFIKETARTVTALAAVQSGYGQKAAFPVSPPGGVAEFVDVHVYVSRWPYRRLAGDETPQLVRKLAANGVTSAWAGSFDALLHRDIAGVNIRLAEDCARHPEVRLLPFGAINPALPDWEEDLRRCHEVHRMPGVRLHPDFHGYTLDDPRFGRLVEQASRRGLVIQVAVGMDDPRLQPPLAMVKPADPAPLVDLLPRYPQARLVLLNYWRSFSGNPLLLSRLNHLAQVSFDIATIELMAGIEQQLKQQPNTRLMFGSYFPFYNFASALGKLHESILSPTELAALRHGHAAAVLRPA